MNRLTVVTYKLLFSFLLIFQPSTLFGAELRQVHAELEYSASVPDLAGFRLYHANNPNPVCTTSDPTARVLDCEVLLDVGVTFFTLTAYDSLNNESAHSNSLTLTVTNPGVPTNNAPSANDGTLSVIEDTEASGTLSASDSDNDTLTYSVVSNGIKGSVVVTDVMTGTYTYTPFPNTVGADAFTFIVNDGILNSNTATVTIIINNVNDTPTISGTPSTTLSEGSAYSFTPTAGDIDAGDILLFTISNKPSWAAFNTVTGALTGTPDNVDVGTTTGIVITVTDNSGASASLPAFSLTVTNIVLPGDIDDNSIVDLNDLYLVQEILAGRIPNRTINPEADINGDGKIGLEEMQYIL
jgi:hypothetical protein